MKKIPLLFLVLSLALGTASAMAYQFDPTNVHVYKGTTEIGWTAAFPGQHWFGGEAYRVMGADLNGSILSVFLNTPASGVDSYAAADLFIDVGCDGSFDTVVQTVAGGAALGINPISTQTLWEAKNVAYGKEFNQASPQTTPGSFSGGTSEVVANVTRKDLGDDGLPYTPRYQLDYDLSNLNLGSQWSFVQTGANCGNDAVAGCVPIPGALLLLGAGLGRLAAYARRRQE